MRSDWKRGVLHECRAICARSRKVQTRLRKRTKNKEDSTVLTESYLVRGLEAGRACSLNLSIIAKMGARQSRFGDAERALSQL